jgi:general secretion pathway protein D
MISLRILSISVFVVALCLPGHADKASSAYKRGERAEAQNNYDGAYEAYRVAYQAKVRNAKYQAAYLRMRFYASAEHVRAGQLQRDAGKLTEAMAEFQRAGEIDHSSFIAQQEVRRTADMLRKQARREEGTSAVTPPSPLAKQVEEAEGPIELHPFSTSPINLRMSDTADKVYQVLGKLAGVNVLLDVDYRPQKISVELNDVTTREALDLVALQSKTFWQPASPNTIFVAAETKRKEVQGNVMKTFYLKNASTPTELQEAANTVKGILDVNRAQLIPTQSAIILRGTPDQMVLAEKLFSDIDKPRSEVVVDIVVMQVSRERLRTLGTNPPTSANVVLVPGAGISGSSGGANQLTLNSLGNLTANDFQVSIPGASVSFLMSDSNTKIIQNPEVRVLDNEKATLKIGDRVPIATGSFAATATGVSPLVNTQFQYLDVGVNIDITPHVHSEDEVTLKMTLEISSVTGTQNIGGISQPIIGQRRIEHETRLQDGEVNLVGGILEESESKSLSGYPWLTKVPILKYLFGQEAKDRRENEIVFAITPHVIRAQDITEQNLRLVNVGNGAEVEVRHKDPAAANANHSSSTASPSRQSGGARAKDQKTVKSGSQPAPPPQKEPEQPAPPPGTAANQPLTDPCPHGQHLVNWQGERANCAFD